MSDLISDQDQVRSHIAKTPAPEKGLGDRTAPIAAPAAARAYVDPAAEAMSQNHNLSPPIHPRRD